MRGYLSYLLLFFCILNYILIFANLSQPGPHYDHDLHFADRLKSEVDRIAVTRYADEAHGACYSLIMEREKMNEIMGCFESAGEIERSPGDKDELKTQVLFRMLNKEEDKLIVIYLKDRYIVYNRRWYKPGWLAARKLARLTAQCQDKLPLSAVPHADYKRRFFRLYHWNYPIAADSGERISFDGDIPFKDCLRFQQNRSLLMRRAIDTLRDEYARDTSVAYLLYGPHIYNDSGALHYSVNVKSYKNNEFFYETAPPPARGYAYCEDEGKILLGVKEISFALEK